MKKPPEWWSKKRIPIKWYEGIYDINEDGQIRTYWRIWNCKNRIDEFPLRYIKPRRKFAKWTCVNARPSAMVTLYDTKKWKRKFYLSRLVARHFMWMTDDEFEDKSVQVLHLDGDMMNAKKSNLKIWTVQERAINYFSLKKLK